LVKIFLVSLINFNFNKNIKVDNDLIIKKIFGDNNYNILKTENLFLLRIESLINLIVML
jgi:hypothetical protein